MINTVTNMEKKCHDIGWWISYGYFFNNNIRFSYTVLKILTSCLHIATMWIILVAPIPIQLPHLLGFCNFYNNYCCVKFSVFVRDFTKGNRSLDFLQLNVTKFSPANPSLLHSFVWIHKAYSCWPCMDSILLLILIFLSRFLLFFLFLRYPQKSDAN